MSGRSRKPITVGLCLALVLQTAGCRQIALTERFSGPGEPAVENDVAKELNKSTLPRYTIEPPDVLTIRAVKVIPKSPYKLQSLDVLQIFCVGTLPGQPIEGTYPIDVNGSINLGPSYGSLKVVGMTVEEATDEIVKLLEKQLTAPEVSVVLAQASGKQEISGEHFVGPDGRVNLGLYGSVYVTGLTLAEAKQAIEEHLSQFLESPEVGVEMYSYASKVYYVIVEGAGEQDNVIRIPCTGNETVLDAIANVQGLSRVSDRQQIWVARPAPDHVGCDQILKVCWNDIVRGGSTATNYQVLPGDRIYVVEDRMWAFGDFIEKTTAPFERIFGLVLLGTQTIQTINRFPDGLFDN